ncbi:MAG: 50S ribosomal protein L29 [Candidatus Omnitrophota bacterium]
MKRIKELREKNIKELEQELLSCKEKLFNLRYQAETGRLEKPSDIRKLRKTVARINTLIKEKQNG